MIEKKVLAVVEVHLLLQVQSLLALQNLQEKNQVLSKIIKIKAKVEAEVKANHSLKNKKIKNNQVDLVLHHLPRQRVVEAVKVKIAEKVTK